MARCRRPAIAAAVMLAACSPDTDPASLPPVPRSAVSLVALGAPDRLPEEPAMFADLAIPVSRPPAEDGGFRAAGLREAALAWGARHGQTRRSWEIAESYAEREAALDTVWSFRRVALPAPMSAGWLLPPVIQRVGAAWSGGGREAEAASEYYRILRPATIKGHLPGWRHYLPAPAPPPDIPANSLLPLEGEEKQWREWAAEGWHAGLELADSEHRESLARLERDYTGMLEFRRLLALGMVTDMVVEAEHWPAAVSGDGAELRVGGRSVRIVSDAAFVGDAGRWTPQLVRVGPAVEYAAER